MTIDNINDYMFERFESYMREMSSPECYEFIYDVFDNKEMLLEKCIEFLKIEDPILLGIVSRTIETSYLLQDLRDHFDYNHIIHCGNCDTYWNEYDSEGEHECAPEDEDPIQTPEVGVVWSDNEEPEEPCCFCKKNVGSNNPAPLMSGLCCDDCNVKLVIPARINK